MTRILHLIPGLTGGGAERQLTLIAPAQAARGHEVHIGIITRDVPPSLVNAPSVFVHRLPLWGHHDPLLLARISSLIRSTRADVVQTWLLLMDIMGASAATLSRTPWILSERSAAAAYPPTIKNNARAAFGRRANAIIANSVGGMQYWLDNGVPQARVTEVPNAVDTTAINSAPPPVLPSECRGRPFVLYVGRLAEMKKPLVLIEALAKALPATGAAAMLCGTGPLANQMKEAIAAHGMNDHIVMAGHRSDVFGLLHAASVCVAISRYEGSPNAVLEAIAAGCPLVVSDIPAYRQLLDDSSALFVPVGDIDATARAIAETLTNTEAAAARAKRAQLRTAALTPAFIAATLDRVYENVLGRSPQT